MYYWKLSKKGEVLVYDKVDIWTNEDPLVKNLGSYMELLSQHKPEGDLWIELEVIRLEKEAYPDNDFSNRLPVTYGKKSPSHREFLYNLSDSRSEYFDYKTCKYSAFILLWLYNKIGMNSRVYAKDEDDDSAPFIFEMIVFGSLVSSSWDIFYWEMDLSLIGDYSYSREEIGEALSFLDEYADVIRQNIKKDVERKYGIKDFKPTRSEYIEPYRSGIWLSADELIDFACRTLVTILQKLLPGRTPIKSILDTLDKSQWVDIGSHFMNTYYDHNMDELCRVTGYEFKRRGYLFGEVERMIDKAYNG